MTNTSYSYFYSKPKKLIAHIIGWFLFGIALVATFISKICLWISNKSIDTIKKIT